MGTRGQFYLYIRTADGKKLLVYSAYSQYDGYDWIAELQAFLKRFLKGHQPRVALKDITTVLQEQYGDEYVEEGEVPHFGDDVEALGHLVLDLEVGTVAPDSSKYPYMEEFECTYGSHLMGTAGDCHYICNTAHIPDVMIETIRYAPNRKKRTAAEMYLRSKIHGLAVEAIPSAMTSASVEWFMMDEEERDPYIKQANEWNSDDNASDADDSSSAYW